MSNSHQPFNDFSEIVESKIAELQHLIDEKKFIEAANGLTEFYHDEKNNFATNLAMQNRILSAIGLQLIKHFIQNLDQFAVQKSEEEARAQHDHLQLSIDALYRLINETKMTLNADAKKILLVGIEKAQLDDKFYELCSPLGKNKIIFPLDGKNIEIRIDEINSLDSIGGGAFGEVFRGEYVGNDENIKKLFTPLIDPVTNKPHYWLIFKRPKQNAPSDAIDDFKKSEQVQSDALSAPYLGNSADCPYNFARAAQFDDGSPLLICEYEHYDIAFKNRQYEPVGGDLEHSLHKMLSSIGSNPVDPSNLSTYAKYKAFTDNIDITFLHFVDAYFKGILAMHKEGKLHLDIATRNALMSQPKKSEITVNGNKIEIPTAYQAKVADFGLTKNIGPDAAYGSHAPIRYLCAKHNLKPIPVEAEYFSLQLFFVELMANVLDSDLTALQNNLDRVEVFKIHSNTPHDRLFADYIDKLHKLPAPDALKEKLANIRIYFQNFLEKKFDSREAFTKSFYEAKNNYYESALSEKIKNYLKNYSPDAPRAEQNALDFIIALNSLQQLDIDKNNKDISDIFDEATKLAKMDPQELHPEHFSRLQLLLSPTNYRETLKNADKIVNDDHYTNQIEDALLALKNPPKRLAGLKTAENFDYDTELKNLKETLNNLEHVPTDQDFITIEKKDALIAGIKSRLNTFEQSEDLKKFNFLKDKIKINEQKAILKELSDLLITYKKSKQTLNKNPNPVLFGEMLHVIKEIQDQAKEFKRLGRLPEEIKISIGKNKDDETNLLDNIIKGNENLFLREFANSNTSLNKVLQGLQTTSYHLLSGGVEVSQSTSALSFVKELKTIKNMDEVFNLYNNPSPLLKSDSFSQTQKLNAKLDEQNPQEIANRLTTIDSTIAEYDSAIQKHEQAIHYLQKLHNDFKEVNVEFYKTSHNLDRVAAENEFNNGKFALNMQEILGIAAAQDEDIHDIVNFAKAMSVPIYTHYQQCTDKMQEELETLRARKELLNTTRNDISNFNDALIKRDNEISTAPKPTIVAPEQNVANPKLQQINDDIRRINENIAAQLKTLQDYAKPRRFDDKLHKKRRAILRAALYNLENKNNLLNETQTSGNLTQDALERRKKYFDDLMINKSVLRTHHRFSSRRNQNTHAIQLISELQKQNENLLAKQIERDRMVEPNLIEHAPKVAFDHSPSKFELRDQLPKQMNDYVKVGVRIDNKFGTHAGIYNIEGENTTTNERIKQQVLFKQNKNTSQNIAEVINSRLMNKLMGEKASETSAFFAKSPDALPDDMNPKDVYVGAISFKNYADLFEVLGFEDRPMPAEVTNREAFLRGFYKQDKNGNFDRDEHGRLQCAFENLAEVMTAAVIARDLDVPLNLGVVFEKVDPKELNEDDLAVQLGLSREFSSLLILKGTDLRNLIADIVNKNGVSYGFILQDFAKACGLKSRKPITSFDLGKQLKFMLLKRGIIKGKLVNGISPSVGSEIEMPTRQSIGFGLAHFHQLPRELKITPEFANELDRQTAIDVKSTIDEAMQEVASVYDTDEIIKFAESRGFDAKKDLRTSIDPEQKTEYKNFVVNAVTDFLVKEIEEKQLALQKLSTEIKLSLCFKKDTRNHFVFDHSALSDFEKLVAANPIYFLQGDFRFRSKDQNNFQKQLTAETNAELKNNLQILVNGLAKDALNTNSLNGISQLLSHALMKEPHKVMHALQNSMQNDFQFAYWMFNTITPIIEHNKLLGAHRPDYIALYVESLVALSENALKNKNALPFSPIEILFDRISEDPSFLSIYQQKYGNDSIDKLKDLYQQCVNLAAMELKETSKVVFTHFDIAEMAVNNETQIPEIVKNMQKNLSQRIMHDFTSTYSDVERTLVLNRWISIMSQSFVERDYQTAQMINDTLNDPLFLNFLRTHRNLLSENASIVQKVLNAAHEKDSVRMRTAIETDLHKMTHMQPGTFENRNKNEDVIPPISFFMERGIKTAKIFTSTTPHRDAIYLQKQYQKESADNLSHLSTFKFNEMTNALRSKTIPEIIPIAGASKLHPVAADLAIDSDKLKQLQTGFKIILDQSKSGEEQRELQRQRMLTTAGTIPVRNEHQFGLFDHQAKTTRSLRAPLPNSNQQVTMPTSLSQSAANAARLLNEVADQLAKGIQKRQEIKSHTSLFDHSNQPQGEGAQVESKGRKKP